MDKKRELAEQISRLAGNLEPNQILELMSGYHVGLESLDFASLIDHFIDAKKRDGFADETLDNYRERLVIFDGFVGKQATEITADDVRGYLTYLRDDRNNKVGTVQTALSILRTFFVWLCAEEVIAKNPVGHVKYAKADKLESKRPLSSEQLEILRAACKTSLEKALLEFLYSSGARVSEATKIDIDDIDFENRRVLVTGAHGKRRTLYFSAKAKIALMQYLKDRRGDTALLCGRQRPYGRMTADSIEKTLRNLGKRAGIERHVTPTVLRHTLAADLFSAGMDIKIIQKILGHKSVKTTEIYAELSEDRVRREYDRFLS